MKMKWFIFLAIQCSLLGIAFNHVGLAYESMRLRNYDMTDRHADISFFAFCLFWVVRKIFMNGETK